MGTNGATTPVQGDWVDRVVGLDDVRVEIAFVRTPDGHGRLELTKFHNPTATTTDPRDLGPIHGAPAPSHDQTDDPRRQRDDRRDRHHIEHLRCSQPEQ